MRKRFPTLCIWLLAYLALIAVGARVGLNPLMAFSTLLLLFIPPFFACLRANRKVVKRTREAFPAEWAALNRDWLKLELRYYFYDDQTFGDPIIAEWKGELRWWTRAGIVGIAVFLPTLFLIAKLSK